MPLALDYEAPVARGPSHARRVVRATIIWAVVGGLAAAVLLIVLHPTPFSAVPAAPVYLVCVLLGGGDWGAILFIWAGGFVLYGIYGFLTTVFTQRRHHTAAATLCLTLHAIAAVLCELSRRGYL